MRQHSFQALGTTGFHRVAYREWGDPNNPRVLLCVHGLTRTGRDFDLLAEALAERWRVVCPDMPGRGDSAWLPVKTDYAPPTYRSVCAAMIARLDVDQVDWLGTSMGGIIGMSLAAMPEAPIRRLIVNDVGPFVPAVSLKRIGTILGLDPLFPSLEKAEAAFRRSMTTFGITRPEHWRKVTEVSIRPAEGGFRLNYDPGIAVPYLASMEEDISFWPLWDAIRCPVLVIRGADSDLLLAETAAEMGTRGPPSDLVEIKDCGHAPMLMEAEQIAMVQEWLERPEGGKT